MCIIYIYTCNSYALSVVETVTWKEFERRMKGE